MSAEATTAPTRDPQEAQERLHRIEEQAADVRRRQAAEAGARALYLERKAEREAAQEELTRLIEAGQESHPLLDWAAGQGGNGEAAAEAAGATPDDPPPKDWVPFGKQEFLGGTSQDDDRPGAPARGDVLDSITLESLGLGRHLCEHLAGLGHTHVGDLVDLCGERGLALALALRAALDDEITWQAAGDAARPVLDWLAREQAEAPHKPHERRCRECGCVDTYCPSCIARTGRACSWAEEDLCTACAPVTPAPPEQPPPESTLKGEPIGPLGVSAADLDAAYIADRLAGDTAPPKPPAVKPVEVNGIPWVCWAIATDARGTRAWSLLPLYPLREGAQGAFEPPTFEARYPGQGHVGKGESYRTGPPQVERYFGAVVRVGRREWAVGAPGEGRTLLAPAPEGDTA